MKGVIGVIVLSLCLSTLFSLVSSQLNLAAADLRKIPHCAGNRTGQVIVHLFSWRWKDVAAECENVLGPKGYCGVQVSPPNEHRIVTSPKNRPWWERYQPVSYKLESNSGSRSEFIDMVERCNAAGVRIYIDAVINHMVAADAGVGTGSGGSFYDSKSKTFDGVPYGPADFNDKCTTTSGNIEDPTDDKQARDCALLSLLDLDTRSTYVRNKIVEYFNDMLAIGIDGYRIDAAKHMWQSDLDAILRMTNNTNSGEIPFVYHEVINLSANDVIKADDYDDLGRVTEFKYGAKLAEIFLADTIPLTNMMTFGYSWGMLLSRNSLVFIDNHDNQRGHGAGGDVITFKTPRDYRMATVFMLSWPYGVPRVMSSYDFADNDAGPPSASPGTSKDCQNGWICEHRWRPIANMVEWRNYAGSADIDNWWSNGNNQIAFSRGNSAFIAFNKNEGDMNKLLKTGLPGGEYCDIISGNIVNNQCTGKTITVRSDSNAEIRIPYGSTENPIIAFHLGSKLSHVPTTRNPTAAAPMPSAAMLTTSPAPPADIQRTIIFLKKVTKYKEDIFIRGGYGDDKEIPIQYPAPRDGGHFMAYNSWSKGDTHLSWEGAENGQGTFEGASAQGSPMVWTDSNSNSHAYVSFNTFGDHFWMWDVMMDCSKLPNGFFEFKGYSNWFQFESNIGQQFCVGQPSPSGISSINHIAKCGYKNQFRWNEDFCVMERL